MDIVDKIKGTGISVDELSKSTGIPTGRIYKWFEGKSAPKYADAIKLEDFLNGKSIHIKDATVTIIETQIELIAATRVILSILAEVQGSLQNRLPVDLANTYRRMVKDEAKHLQDELHSKNI